MTSGAGRRQLRCLALCLVCATQRLPTLRPLSDSVNANVTVALSESSKPKVVPTGALRLTLLMFAGPLPSIHFEG